jgi:hypothetical protein
MMICFFPLKDSRLKNRNKKLGKMMEGHLEDYAPNIFIGFI